LAIVNGSRPFAARDDRRATIDEPEVRRILASLVQFPRRRNADPLSPWLEALTAARLGERDPVQVERSYGGDVDGFAEVFPRYRAELRRRGQADFDEQVVLAVEALETERTTLTTARAVCRYLLVDEFQDLTPAHLHLVRLLAGPEGNVFAVGDDDQTIYGYNGADPAWLIDFSTYFPGAAEHALTVNYRCPPDVVEVADRLLRHNRRRVPKVIHAARSADGLTLHPSTDDTVSVTLDIVRSAVAAGTTPSDIAVLTRVNSLLAPVQAALVGAGIPVTGGVGREFVQRTSVHAALAWLRLADGGPFAGSDLDEALRRPSRGLSPKVGEWVAEQRSLDGIRRLATRLNSERDADRVAALATDIERLARTSGTEARLLMLRDGLGLGASVAGLDRQRHGMNRAAQSDDLLALVQLARLAPSGDFEQWLTRTLAQPWSSGGVTLSTVHRVKGLEWPTVVVHHASDDQFPHRLADDLEEERRLFHVAITRCSSRVHVVAADTPSPFIAQLTNEPPPPRAGGDTRPAIPVARSSQAAPARPGHDLTTADAALFAELKDLRRHLAQGKPAYVVFGDAVLDTIARTRPTDLEAFACIPGVGPAKLGQYGQAFVDAVNGFEASFSD
jgi:DNA helicase-2/ATP-dependent DNA helicase PcrA